MTRALVRCVLLAALLAGCQQQALACEEPNPLVPHPRGGIVPGVRIGPLLVSTGMWNGEHVGRVPWGRPEDLAKFLIARVDRVERPLTLTGRRCEDGRALRFVGAQPWLRDARLTLEEIEKRTNPSVSIDATPPPDVGVVGELPVWGGYFIFTAPGRYKLEARDGERLVAAAVIEVVVGRWELREVPSDLRRP